MRQQQIGFCTASDGVRIAYATVGSGPPLLYVTGWPGHLELEWEKPFVRSFLLDLAEGFTLVRYDMRGSGLSDLDVPDLAFESLGRDLEAIVEHLGLHRFALLSLGDLAGPLAIQFAADHPNRVTHVVLNSCFLRGEDLASPEQQAAIVQFVLRYGFPIFEFIDAPGIDVETQRGIREIQEMGASHEIQAEVLRTMYAVHVEDRLDALDMPVLVMHARKDNLVPFHLGREVAIRLGTDRANFVPYEAASIWASRNIVVQAIRQFLGASPAEGDRPPDVAVDVLTLREAEVLRLIAGGLTSRQIADELVLSVRTVERHISNVYTKLDLHSRAQATAFALRHGLLRGSG